MNEFYGFCDVFVRVYGVVVYLCIVIIYGNYIRFVVLKIRVVFFFNQIILCLELLLVVVFVRLIYSVKEVFIFEIEISSLVCWIDLKVVWYWIVQSMKEWKQFVQYCVDEIRKLVFIECWNYCFGLDNLVDIFFRGMDCCDLIVSILWWNGLKWLIDFEEYDELNRFDEELFFEECFLEMKVKD